MTEVLSLDLSFTTIGERTVFDRRRYRWPQTVGRVFRLDPEDAGRGRVIVQNSGASLHPGDLIEQRIAANASARIDVVGQGAMLVTGTSGGQAGVERTELRVDDHAQLVFRPEPRILTPYAHVQQETHVDVRGAGTVLVTDAVVVHPDVTAETFGSFLSRVTVTTAGRLRSLDAQHASALPFPKSGLRAFASVYLLGAGFVDVPVNDLDGVYAATTTLPDDAGVAVRLAATGGDRLRAGMECAVALLTTHACMQAGSLP